jgi:hypothetical protein
MTENTLTEAVREAKNNDIAEQVAFNEWWNHFRTGMSDKEFRASIRRAVLCGLNHKEGD